MIRHLHVHTCTSCSSVVLYVYVLFFFFFLKLFLISDQSTIYYTAMDVVNSAENLSLECNDLIEKLNIHCAPLLQAVEK